MTENLIYFISTSFGLVCTRLNSTPVINLGIVLDRLYSVMLNDYLYTFHCAMASLFVPGHVEMNWDLQFPGVGHSDEPERMTDLYETIVTYVGGFILSASVQEFALVEQILLESIMQPAVWRALLAMDIWCIMAR